MKSTVPESPPEKMIEMLLETSIVLESPPLAPIIIIQASLDYFGSTNSKIYVI